MQKNLVKDPLEKVQALHSNIHGFSLVAQMVRNLPIMRETWVQSLGWGRSPGGGHGDLLQYSCLENPLDKGAWWATVHGITKNQTQLSDEAQHGTCVCTL